MSQEGATNNVIKFKPRTVDDDVPICSKPRERPMKSCHCVRFELDESVRRVYCRDCGKEKPAFDVLMVLRHEFEKWTKTRDHAKSQARAAESRLEEIKRQERNAKARLRRLERRL